MKIISLLSVVLGTLASIAALSAAAPSYAQQSQCPKLADVEWWSNSVPEVRRLVANTYEGNWDSYIQRWEQQRKELQTTYDNGGVIEIKSRGLLFRDDELKNYINMVDDRILTLYCLKKEFGNERAAQAPSPAAAGAPKSTPAPDPTTQDVKAIEGQNLDLEVAAMCQNGVPAFQVTNLGDRWPRLGEVSLYRTDTKGMIVQRRVRMTNSQQMIFKVPDSIAKDATEVGIFIEPSWYTRQFAFDAKISC